MKDYALLDVPKTLVAAGNKQPHQTSAGILCGAIVDQTGKTHRM